MFERKPDLREEIISLLRTDKERLELRVAELTNQLIALTSRAAYRELHPREPLPVAEKVGPYVDPRRLEYKPKVSFDDIQAAFTRKLEKEN